MAGGAVEHTVSIGPSTDNSTVLIKIGPVVLEEKFKMEFFVAGYHRIFSPTFGCNCHIIFEQHDFRHW